MALEGSIKDFGVADILQLISQQQKTGILLVERQDASSEVYFSNGEITETRSGRQMARLEEILVKGNLISPENLKSAAERQKETFEYLGQILLKDGLITKDVLEHIIVTQIYETFYDILQWREGKYRFITQNIKVDSTLTTVPRLESILLDVLRMIDEWPDIKSIIRSFSMVFARVPEHTQEGLDADELLVYSLIDDKKTVQEIIDGCILGKFAACKILVGLLEHGYIMLIAERAEKKPAERAVTSQKTIALTSAVGLCVIMFGLLLLPTKFPGSIMPALTPGYFRTSYLHKYLTNNKMEKLKKSLELFQLTTGSYPEAVQELVSAGILTDKELKAYDFSTISYSREGNFYGIK